jgi:MFS family permease
MSFGPYRALLAQRDVRHLLLVGVLARVPHTTVGLVLTFHVVGTLDRSYLEAGVVAAAGTLGLALGAPWRGRAIDRLGLRRALVPSVVAEGVIWGCAPFLPYGALVAASVVGGLLALPVFTVVRQSLSVLLPPERLRSGYAIDSVFVELSFVVGPALGVLVITRASTTWALLGVGAAAVVAGLALMVLDPPTRSEQVRGRRVGPDVDRGEAVSGHAPVAASPAERAALEDGPAAAAGARASGRRPGWLQPGLLAVLGAAVGATVVLFGTDVGIVATLRAVDAAPLTGLVFAAWGVGSVAGGLVYGALPREVHPLWLLLGLAVLTAPVGLATTPWLLCLAILPAGALCAPVISATAQAVAAMVPEASRGEAMGWHGSALTLGGAVGAPLAGAAIDALGPWAGFTATAAVGLLFAVTGLALVRLRRVAVPVPA